MSAAIDATTVHLLRERVLDATNNDGSRIAAAAFATAGPLRTSAIRFSLIR
jgi:hypothetical protein